MLGFRAVEGQRRREGRDNARRLKTKHHPDSSANKHFFDHEKTPELSGLSSKMNTAIALFMMSQRKDYQTSPTSVSPRRRQGFTVRFLVTEVLNQGIPIGQLTERGEEAA